MKGIAVFIDRYGNRTAELVTFIETGRRYHTASNGTQFCATTGVKRGQSKYKRPMVCHYEGSRSYEEALEMHNKGGEYWKINGL